MVTSIGCAPAGGSRRDGTRLKAVNSSDRNFTREKLVKMIRSDERLADYLSRLDRTDAEEDGASGRPAS